MRRKLAVLILTAMVSVMISIPGSVYAMEDVVPEAIKEEAAQEEAEGMVSMSTFMSANDEANIRSGPDTTYEILGKTEIDRTLYVTGQTSDGLWYRISLEGQEAYISAEFVNAPAETGDLDAELAQSMADSEQEATEELKAQEEAIRQAEQQAQEEAAAQEAEQKAAEEKAESEKKNMNWAVILVGCFVVIFGASIFILIRVEKQKAYAEESEDEYDDTDEEADGRPAKQSTKKELEIIDLDMEDE